MDFTVFRLKLFKRTRPMTSLCSRRTGGLHRCPLLPAGTRVWVTRCSLGFPDPGLQEFALKVLAHGHHGGNRVANRRRDDARHFPAALSYYQATIVLGARQNCWTVPGGIAGSAFWFGLANNSKPKGGFPKQNKELTKYKVSLPKHNKALTKYNEELAKQNKASPKQNKDLTKYKVSLPKHNKAFTKYNEELPKQNKRSK
jgi:hypothetical protein